MRMSKYTGALDGIGLLFNIFVHTAYCQAHGKHNVMSSFTPTLHYYIQSDVS